VDVIQSDLFRQYPADSRFDLVYENLPNIPDADDIYRDLRAASCFEAGKYAASPASERYLLTLHHNFLLEAPAHLNPGGWVVSAIGGRIPHAVIAEMFRRSGFRPVVLAFGLKVQTEAAIVLAGYARAERRGSPEFSFYHPVEACVRIARQCQDLNDDQTCDVYVQRMNTMLARCRVSACQALALVERGDSVCHSIYLIGGTRTTFR
jgi:hypothetical protein